ncbi:unnamed protein product [Phytophthora fragariaefolia]|uniref:Unnamed protein product n=1 Tax=Phytophthora fragariaefolia TaxID=1490495 RepID=A0A9W6YB68_9STRA|nr:unnamed protein product [Phytophthora fragariaefolia]
MAKVTTSPSGLSPATAVGSPRARIDSANSADPTDTATMAATDATVDKARSIQFDDEALRGHGSEEDDEGEDEEEKAEFGDVKTTAELLGEVEELSLQVSQMGRPLPVGRYLAAELEDDADDNDDDDEQGVAPGDRPPLIPRATRNADTPSANRVFARHGEEMRSESEWMMMFAPVALTQATWPVLGPELTQPVNSTDINQLVEDTVLLLKAMGFRCNGRPNSLILGDWSLSLAGAELLKWKRRLRLAFGLERHVGSRQMIARRTAEFPRLDSDPSRVPLPKTPETKKGKKEVFRATKGTPYYEDAHMQTPKTLKGRSTRYAEFYDAADEAELGGGDSDDDQDYRDNAEDSAKDVIRRLSLDDAERDRGHYLEVRSHASLDKIAECEGKRYRSDDSLQWLKRFIYEMKGTRMPQDSWCEPFMLCLGRAAKSWYRQLPKKTQRRWNLLSEAFLDYYCSQVDQSARTRYYSARRKENEPICDFLIRLNGYARTAKIQYGKGGADAADHVEHFLLNCGDDDIMDLLYPMRLDDIERVEKIINTKIHGEKRNRQRDRLSGSRSRDGRRVESQRRAETTRPNENRKSERRDDRREYRRDDRREYRRDDRRTRREDGRDRRVTVAVTSDDEEGDEAEYQPSRRLGQLDYDDDDSDYGREGYLDSEEESGHDYIVAGLADEKSPELSWPWESSQPAARSP